MPTSLIMVKHLGALRPTDEQGVEVLRKVWSGEAIKCTITRPRNIKFHNKFFAMLGIVLKNQEHYASMDELLGVCKIRIGHVTVVSTGYGTEKWPKSISFAAMDETEFSAFYDRAVDWVLREVIPGLQRQHLDAEVEAELIGFAA